MFPDLPFKAISIMQPWAWLIVNGHKEVENRDWPTKFRGLVAIHAGKKVDLDCATALSSMRHPVTGEHHLLDRDNQMGKGTGGIVGVAEIVDCVAGSLSPWFVGKQGFIIKNARPVPFIPVRGALGFFDWRKNL